MFPYLKDGKLFVPMRAEGRDGLLGDGWVEMTKDDPQYQATLDWVRTFADHSISLSSTSGSR